MSAIRTENGHTMTAEDLNSEWGEVWLPMAKGLALNSRWPASTFASAIDRLRKMGVSPEKVESIMKAAIRWDVDPDALSMAVWVIHND